MFLKRLELQGFKTFSARTVIEFGEGVNAVVGPNGSGKSNIADAVRWALGEQSPRSVRCKQATDVIFAGTTRRPSMGMAEVILTFDNSTGWLPVPTVEVSVGRRAYRSGETDYLLNGARVRLRDVTDVLRQVSLEAGGYVVIAQGMVDAMLSQRGDERRTLVESVAGLHHYYARRSEAEGQLERTETNLSAVQAVIAETEPTLVILEQQASVARDYQQARTDLHAALTIWYAHALSSLYQTRARSLHEQQASQAALTTAQDTRAAAEADLASVRQRETDLAARVDAGRQERRRQHRVREEAERDLAVARARLAAHDGRVRDVAADLARATAHLAVSSAEVDRAAQAVQEADAAVQTHTDATESAATRLRELDALLKAATETVQARERERGLTRQRLADLQHAASGTAQRLARLHAEQQAHHAALERAANDLATAQAALASLPSALTAAQQSMAQATCDDQAASEALASVTTQARRAADAAAAAAREQVSTLARLRQVQTWIADLTSSDHLPTATLRLSTLLTIPDAWQPAIAAALGSTLSAAVLDRPDDLPHLLAAVPPATVLTAILSAVPPSRAERGQFLDSLRQSVQGDLCWADEIVAPLAHPVVMGVLSPILLAQSHADLLAVAHALRAMMAQGTVLAPLAMQVTVVSPDGHLVRGGRLYQQGQDNRWADLLRYQQEIGSLQQVTIQQQRDVDAARAAEQQAHAQTRHAEASLRTARATRRTIEDDVARLSTDLTVRQRAVTSMQAEQQRAAVAMSTSQSDEARLHANHQAADAAVSAQQALVTAADTTLTTAQHERAALLSTAEEHRRASASASNALALVRSRRQDAQRLLDRARASAEQDHREVAAKHVQEASLRIEGDSLHQQAALAQQGAATAIAAIRALDADLTPLQADLDLLHAQHDTLAGRLARSEADTATHTAALASATAALERIAREIATLADAIAGDVGCEPDELLPVTDAAPSSGRLRALRARIAEFGAVNARAVEDYEATLARLTFLRTQASDLIDGVARLRGLIEEANREVRQRFSTTLTALDAAFRDYFVRLFGGGSCAISATYGPDSMPLAVEIQAQPPGKRTQDLALLSGGERAMVALALLFGLLSLRPVPFCLLDEVEAALDEANTGRFMSILRGLADKTQFLLITHNRGTMVQADALYGITMGEAGLSQIASLRLAAAVAFAE